METNKGNGFIGYEYMEVAADRQMEAVYADSYPSFGWRLDACTPCVQGLTRVTMKFKRDRKIRNKAELTRLQRQFESGAAEIAALEKSKTLGASAAAFLIGIVGTAFMAGSVFSYLAGMLPLCILLAVPAFAGWILPTFCYAGLRRRRAAKVGPLIDRQYETIYAVCEKASALLGG